MIDSLSLAHVEVLAVLTGDGRVVDDEAALEDLRISNIILIPPLNQMLVLAECVIVRRRVDRQGLFGPLLLIVDILIKRLGNEVWLVDRIVALILH